MIKKIKRLKFIMIEDSLVLLNGAWKSSLFRSAGVYTVTNILSNAIPFLLLPIFTRYLTPQDYGIVAMFTVVIGMVSVFIGLSVNGAIARQYYEKDSVDFSAYMGNCLYILIGSTIVVAIAFLLFPGFISKYTAIPVNWLWAVIVSSIAQFIIAVTLLIWQVEVKPIKYGLFQIFLTLSNIGLSVFFIVFLKMNWSGRINAQVISTSIFAFFGLIILFKNHYIKFKFNKKYLKNALSFGVPLIPHSFGGLAMTMMGRLLVTNMVGVAETGIYTVGVQVGTIISLLASSFNSAYFPWLFSQLKKESVSIKLKIVKLTYFYYVAILLLAILLSLFAPWFLNFFLGKNFITASKFVIWIALGAAFNGMYFMVTNYIFYTQKTYLLTWGTFITSAFSFVITYFLIKLNGSIGAAQGMAISFFMLFVLTWVFSSKVYKMPWFFKKS